MLSRLGEAFGTFFKRGDGVLLFLCLAANLFGLVLIYSATRYDPDLHNAVYKQAAAMAIGVAAYFLFTFLDVESFLDGYWKLLPVCNVLLILILIPLGIDGGTGNKSWIELPLLPFNLQPAEIAKLSFVCLLALQFHWLQRKGVSRPLSVLQTAGHTLLFCGLIAAVSGDMGMVLVYLFIYVVMAWSAGVKFWWFLLGGAGAAGACWLAWPHIPTYIQMRFLVVLDHTLDPLGKGFHQMRSLLAIGSGQIFGQGYLHGTQTQNTASDALPARHTDFIFAVAGEELGMIGCIAILALLLLIILRCVYIARIVRNPVCSYIAMGYAGMLAVQTCLNIGMCLFVAPVVGLTLPFFSYGGSSLVTMYVAMGILSGMKMRSLPPWLRRRY